MAIILISDLHLSENSPELTEKFIKFLDDHQHIEQLFILGDLFELWIGDDEKSLFIDKIKLALRKFSEKGIKIRIMHGNRDFLIGHKFIASINAELIKDPFVLEYNQQTIVLTHGDLLCSDDKSYQHYRQIVHHQLIQTFFLLLPLKLRLLIANKLRKQSKKHTRQLNPQALDANDAQVNQLQKNYHADIIIHGHTHLPAIHEHKHCKRFVLGAWHDAGEGLILDQSNALRLTSFAR